MPRAGAASDTGKTNSIAPRGHPGGEISWAPRNGFWRCIVVSGETAQQVTQTTQRVGHHDPRRTNSYVGTDGELYAEHDAGRPAEHGDAPAPRPGQLLDQQGRDLDGA